MTNFCFSFMHLDTLLLHICFMSPFAFFIGHQQSCVRHLCNCIFLFLFFIFCHKQAPKQFPAHLPRGIDVQVFKLSLKRGGGVGFAYRLFWRVLGQAIIAMCGLMTKRNFYMISFTAHIFNGSIKVYS